VYHAGSAQALVPWSTLDEAGAAVPDPEQVLDWLEGRLAPEDAAAVAAAVEADPELASIAAWLRNFLALASTARMDELPPRTHAFLREQFALHRPAPPRPHRQLFATLRFDSAEAARPVGVRAAAAGAGPRHLVLESEELDIALDVYPAARAWAVEGQLLPRGDLPVTAAQVRLVGVPGGVVASSFTDSSGSFTMDLAMAGPHLLQVLCGDLAVDAELELP
jgi:hypothetical protein